MPRFALLTHDHPVPHWDLLLEEGAACATWRLSAEPGPGRAVPAERIADHRLHYLTHEGPVSGDRGTVARWDAGGYVRVDAATVKLSGTRVCGRCVFGEGTVTFAP